MADLDLATILADGEYLRRVGDTLDGGPGGAGVDAEGAVDATAAAFAAGTHTNITVTYNDAANSISLASTAAGGGLTDGDKGDITVGGSGTTLTIDPAAVTYAKIQAVTADTLLGRSSPGAGTAQEVSCTAYARSAFLGATGASSAQANMSLVPGADIVPVAAIVTYSATSNTAAASDAFKYLRFTGTNPTYTVPPNSTVSIPVKSVITGIGTATAMTLIQGSGVTITKARTLVTVGAGSGWTLIKTGTDTWDLHGDLV